MNPKDHECELAQTVVDALHKFKEKHGHTADTAADMFRQMAMVLAAEIFQCAKEDKRVDAAIAFSVDLCRSIKLLEEKFGKEERGDE